MFFAPFSKIGVSSVGCFFDESQNWCFFLGVFLTIFKNWCFLFLCFFLSFQKLVFFSWCFFRVYFFKWVFGIILKHGFHSMAGGYFCWAFFWVFF